jgi:hypothetical protein
MHDLGHDYDYTLSRGFGIRVVIFELRVEGLGHTDGFPLTSGLGSRV